MPSAYTWPQKVRRYQIICPLQRILVAKHEAQIDWNKQRIQSPETLDQHIREVMLPTLHSWISKDHPESHYCKTINLPRILGTAGPLAMQARQIADIEGSEAATEFLLSHINQHKKEQFDAWWNYVTKENPLYTRHPAFQYLVLRRVFESSTAKQTRAPLALDPHALAKLFDHMARGEVAPNVRLLPLLSQIMAFGTPTEKRPIRLGSDCNWVAITSRDNNAAARLAALSQKSGWCVASVSMAESYLEHSDFHLLVQDGCAVAALRVGRQGENGHLDEPFLIEEIRGKWNQDPGRWWPQILLHIAAHNGDFFSQKNERSWRQDFGAHSARKRLMAKLAAAAESPKKLAAILRRQPALVHLLDPAWLAELKPDHGPENDSARLIVEQAWSACIRADPACYALIPLWMQDLGMRENLIKVWLEKLAAHPSIVVPETLLLDERIQTQRKAGWLEILKALPRIWERCPKEILHSLEAVEVLRPRWVAILERDVCAWEYCPQILKHDKLVLTALETAWIQYLRGNPLSWCDCPPVIQREPSVILAAEAGWSALLENQPRTWARCPPFLRSREQVKKALHAGWAQLVTRNPRAYPKCPPSARKIPVVLAGLKSGWIALLKRDPVEWTHCPQFMLRRTAVIKALEDGWGHLLARNPRAWNQCPAKFLSRGSVKMTLVSAWIQLLRTAPTSFSALPPALESLPEIQAARREGWMRRIAQDPKAWALCSESLRQDAEIYEAMVAGWVQILPTDPQAGKQLPLDLGSNPKIQEALRSGWMDLLRRAPRAWVACPPELRTVPDLTTALKQGWSALLQTGRATVAHLPCELRSDPSVAAALLI